MRTILKAGLHSGTGWLVFQANFCVLTYGSSYFIYSYLREGTRLLDTYLTREFRKKPYGN